MVKKKMRILFCEIVSRQNKRTQEEGGEPNRSVHLDAQTNRHWQVDSSSIGQPFAPDYIASSSNRFIIAENDEQRDIRDEQRQIHRFRGNRWLGEGHTDEEMRLLPL
jgi:hypothetical protein